MNIDRMRRYVLGLREPMVYPTIDWDAVRRAVAEARVAGESMTDAHAKALLR